MCMSTPDIPDPPPPTQEVKPPGTDSLQRGKRKNATMSGGSLLTGPSGVTSSALNTGAPTLLGG